MPTHTRLTTPGGAAPDEDVPVERWMPGPRIPVEPEPAPRWRRLVLPGVAGLVLGGVVSTVVVLADRAASQDPSLDVPGLEQPADDGSPGEEPSTGD